MKVAIIRGCYVETCQFQLFVVILQAKFLWKIYFAQISSFILFFYQKEKIGINIITFANNLKQNCKLSYVKLKGGRQYIKNNCWIFY